MKIVFSTSCHSVGIWDLKRWTHIFSTLALAWLSQKSQDLYHSIWAASKSLMPNLINWTTITLFPICLFITMHFSTNICILIICKYTSFISTTHNNLFLRTCKTISFTGKTRTSWNFLNRSSYKQIWQLIQLDWNYSCILKYFLLFTQFVKLKNSNMLAELNMVWPIKIFKKCTTHHVTQTDQEHRFIKRGSREFKQMIPKSINSKCHPNIIKLMD